jgi:PilZ domain-containing protein
MKDSSRKGTFQESRRSTRVPLKVLIRVEDNADSVSCEGETVVVNLHGALLNTAQPLKLNSHIVIQVHLTGKQARAEVVYVDAANPLNCGIALIEPRNIWGVSLPPDDWAASMTDAER